MKHVFLIAIVFVLSVGFSTKSRAQKSENMKINAPESVFPKGRPAPSDFFTGNAWVTGLIQNDSVFTTVGGKVFFEAGARSNWHSHPAGQILIVTAGVGYHQLRGKPIEVIHKGDVVKCPPDIDHWPGASKESSMTHIYIVPNTEKGIVTWKEPVTDEEYNSL